MVQTNDKYYVSESEGSQLIDRARRARVSQAFIGQKLNPSVSQSMVGQILRGEAPTTLDKISEIKNIIAKGEKVKKYKEKVYSALK